VAEVEKENFQVHRPTSLPKRYAIDGEVASLVAHVCSPLSSATNGAALRVNGGGVKAGF
jgi:NAD(P)-dependent dehydrogenase (short-subunit alcohol dehydrogenase family)